MQKSIRQLNPILFVLSAFFVGPMSFASKPITTGRCYEMPAQACEAFYLVNSNRSIQGLQVLQYSAASFRMAQEQSEDMARREYFDHSRPGFPDRGAESFKERAARFGLSTGVGENIAAYPTAVRAVAGWMKSSGHRKNILNSKYRSSAVGYANGLYTQVFSFADTGER